MDKEKIEHLIESSKNVIQDCALENGAIVAANSTKEYYDREAKNYFYVWPRDAAFTCMAAKLVGITDIQPKFFDWVEERAEDADEHGHIYKNYTGLLYEKYYPNGLQALHRFQPDQGGALLFAMEDYLKDFPELKERYQNLVNGLAEGLCKSWKVDHFASVTNDLWEERHTFPDLKDNFTYSLASCAAGLRAANKLFANDEYVRVANEMEHALRGSTKGLGFFFRSAGKIDDVHTDASLLGLVWPFGIIGYVEKEFADTVEMIIERLDYEGGIHRYELDEYDGWMYRGFHRKKGAGYWPLLNFWMAIVLNKMGRREDAERYYNQVLLDIGDSNLIPEQIFNNNIQKSVSPLCWSHAMFIFASKELGLMQ